jgi:hypothetical protein
MNYQEINGAGVLIMMPRKRGRDYPVPGYICRKGDAIGPGIRLGPYL